MEIRQILLRTDTAANWLSVDPVLGAGEIGTESDTGRFKIGNGSSAWSLLGYGRVDLLLSRTATTVTVGASGDDAVLPAATGSLAGVMSAADKSKLDGITTIGDVSSSGNNTFTGVNGFYNSSGQSFGTDAQAEDGVVLAGRAGGTASRRVTLRPAALDGNHELTLPSRSGTVITSADSGTITSAMIADGAIVDGDISGSAAIADSKLATISAAGKVANSATTATSANTASAIVARDGSGNFSAGTITAALSGNAATASAFNGTRTFSVTGDVTGSVASTFSGNVSLGLELAAGAIVNADINAAAAIADSKLDTIATADKVSLTALNIDGATDIGAALADADLFVVDDGGAGTNRKAAATRITDYTFGKVSGDITIASNGTAAIGSGVIVNADISASAAIAHSKLANLTSGQILLGNASNVPTGTAVTGDVTISNTGVTAIASGVVVDADINASAAIAHTKLASITAGQVLLGNASNVPTATALSGDVTISSTGVTAIGGGVIVNADVSGSAAIAGSKITPAFGAQNISTTARSFVGTTTARTTAYGDIGHFQVEGEGKSVVHTHTGVNAFSNAYVFIKVRGTGTQSVLNGDTLGIVSFQGADGTGYVRAAEIQALVDGAPGTNDMPGRLVFLTTADGQSVPTERMRIDSTGVVTIEGTAALAVPDGTTAQRPASPAAGMIRLNTTLGQFEGYSGSAWGTIGGGAKGGGPDQVFFENDQVVTTDYTMTSGKNAVTAGPVTVNSGITVTIPSGSVWSIV